MAAYSKQVSYKCALTSYDLQGADVCKGKTDQLGIRAQLQKTALNNLIDEELVREYAQKHNLQVSQQDFNNEWNAVYAKKFRRNMPALKNYARKVGLSVDDVKNIVRDDMLQQRVLGAVTLNMPVNVPATMEGRMVVGSAAQAAAVQKDMSHGIPFIRILVPLSKRYKNMCAQVGCGDRLWTPNAFLPANQQAVATAPPSSLVGPFSLQGGLLLIFVEKHAKNYPLTPSQEYSLRQQVFARWVSRQAAQAHVQRYVAAT
ncbi:MAG: hypothetical protein NVS2B16_23300 [Chloroflexota bacterium]